MNESVLASAYVATDFKLDNTNCLIISLHFLNDLFEVKTANYHM